MVWLKQESQAYGNWLANSKEYCTFQVHPYSQALGTSVLPKMCDASGLIPHCFISISDAPGLQRLRTHFASIWSSISSLQGLMQFLTNFFCRLDYFKLKWKHKRTIS